MTSSAISYDSPLNQETEVWENLKQAIARCSGFKQWQSQQGVNGELSSLDQQIRSYLRETLETLAY
ncbi:conserved hypothetical protein [Rippkaea orientalis PCC 8801]|uniref:Uncharacterized protein n=1 Tax=Rippkaea orientalis (strain PCC 8801 / RF-1) TaxID=41431 RepID=B7K656_RIPO1|nr:hypothetical protein [Rippkaea orientalis]ACK68109.1 conserved hypothetical protein [Rippkaea orientalis PCC 8801]